MTADTLPGKERTLKKPSDFLQDSFLKGYLNTERRGWDSNPCALADKRFSRPPRYDHFDTSPDRSGRFQLFEA